jgi:hypothetical protein
MTRRPWRRRPTPQPTQPATLPPVTPMWVRKAGPPLYAATAADHTGVQVRRPVYDLTAVAAHLDELAAPLGERP